MDGMDKAAGRPLKVEKVTSADRQVLAVRMGRGRTGGSTLADWIIQFARQARRAVTARM